LSSHKQNKEETKKGWKKIYIYFKTLFISSLFANFGFSFGMQGFANGLVITGLFITTSFTLF